MNRFFAIAAAVALCVIGRAQDHPSTPTQVVVLGTGNPNADPERWGPAVAVVVNDRAYLIDCGPGVVRRAAAAEQNGIPALKAKELKIVFITHLHSDHTLGYPDLIFSPWVLGRKEPLEAYGPHGLKSMTSHIEKAWTGDVAIRRRGLEQANATGYKVNVHEIAPGVVYRDENVTVTAFPVKHGIWKAAFGYKFETRDRKIVIAGDTAPTDEVVKACDGCDVLLHEVYNPHGDELHDPHWKEYFRTFHTSPAELGRYCPARLGPSCWWCITRCWSDCRKRIWWSRSRRSTRGIGFRRGTWKCTRGPCRSPAFCMPLRTAGPSSSASSGSG